MFYLYSLYFRKDMNLGKISNLLNIDFEICLTHDDNEFTYSLSIMISKISRIEILHAFLDQFLCD